MDRRIIILTGSELRHTFFRKWLGLATGVNVLRSYCEGAEKSIGAVVERQENNQARLLHLKAREQSERDFFELFDQVAEDRSKPVFLAKGEINLPAHAEEIIRLQPDLLVAFGCSIIKEPLLSAFPGRLVNIHLGLSPYYRGSGTNFWPLVNGEPEYAGATFMHMDAGVDTGEIIHQVRARVAHGDTPHQIGNRLIVDMARTCATMIQNLDLLQRMPQLPQPKVEKYYKKKDYTEESVAQLYKAFTEGMVAEYLRCKDARCDAVPLIDNPALSAQRTA